MIFSEPHQIKEQSLKLYSYLLCLSHFRNTPRKGFDNVKIFQQKNINLSQIKRLFSMDERTIKKCWEGLENEGLIYFTPRDWKETLIVIDENGNQKKTSFNDKWKERRKHPETYYEIPVNENQLYRKIPEITIQGLIDIYNVNELTMKIYMTLVNLQENCIVNGWHYKSFTYKDLCEMVGYVKEGKTSKRMEDCLRNLQSLGLIEIKQDIFINSYGVKIPCFILNQANFYINYDIKDYQTGDYSILPEEVKQAVRDAQKELYPLSFD